MRSHDRATRRAIVSHSYGLRVAYTVLPLLLLFGGCTLAPDRNLQAFNACLTRHPQDAPLCEAPLHAYQLDLPTVAASAAPGPGLRQ